jgi:hypothetical protein
MNVDWDYVRYRRGEAAIPAYPQTAWCFDSAAVGRAFTDHVPGMGHAGRLVDVYARPGKSIDVCHAFSSAHGDVAAITLRCSTTERGGHDVRKARKRLADPARLVSVDDVTFGWIFPEDESLAGLASVHQAMTSGSPEMAIRLLNYRRGERCTFLDVAANTVSKIQPAARDSHNRLTAVYDQPKRRFSMPQPLRCDDGNTMRTESFMPGLSFDKHLNQAGLQAASHSVLSALADLHALPGERLGLRNFHASDVMHRYDAVFLRRLDITGLPVRQACKTLGEQLARHIPAPPSLSNPLHGDMHTGNVLFAEGAATLIDLDEMVGGDPVYDLAMFASELLLLAVLQPDRMVEYISSASAIPEVYESIARREIDKASFAWHLAALIASRQIKSCINHAAPDLDRVTTCLAEIALHIARHESFDFSTS